MSLNSLNSRSDRSCPQVLFGYDVVDFLGEGAGSVIYAVTHPVSRHMYAMKHVIRHDEKSIRFVEQLEVEFNVSRHFQHPNLRRSIDMKINRTMFRRVTEAFLVMELCDGQPLEMSLPDRLVDILNCFLQTAEALESMHKLGLVHCDLKPNNILLSPDGTVKLIDFGQTCPVGTKKERIQGTPDFISPEQVRCMPVTPRTDVFNFGATLYWALTLRKLPTLFTLKKTENSFLFDDVMATPMAVNPNIPEPLSNFVMECVRTNPAKRPADMGAIRQRLEVLLHALSRPESPRNASVA